MKISPIQRGAYIQKEIEKYKGLVKNYTLLAMEVYPEALTCTIGKKSLTKIYLIATMRNELIVRGIYIRTPNKPFPIEPVLFKKNAKPASRIKCIATTSVEDLLKSNTTQYEPSVALQDVMDHLKKIEETKKVEDAIQWNYIAGLIVKNAPEPEVQKEVCQLVSTDYPIGHVPTSDVLAAWAVCQKAHELLCQLTHELV